ncbi:hypothetical protein LOTGIDRAFT_160734 [Lottia gigantea]|uniref:Uncharacterized protein n=1 Tax=Lottia gigantea TaxID=225164 RepID=V4ADQ5_LOTGI|nr:hypothetical protein LOTGIDRAFT_160734 [Lottia gigantea]ESO94982.1 hypothetical protein LOTGIDRAFT_160734 [Lottia gigantea]
MDIEEANKFINSLVKNLQVLCHGHVNFNNSIQVIGHLYLNVDSQTNIDYIVNEKVCKNDNSSTMFVSNSYHSEPKLKKKSKDSTNNNSCESKDQRPQESQEPRKHQKPQRSEREADFQSSFSGHRSPRPAPIHQQVYKRPSQDILSPILRHENCGKKRLRVSETSSESPMLNLSNIKSEPQEVDKEDESDWSYYDHNQSSQGSIEELSNEFISGIRDKKLGVYPVAVHPNEDNIPFNLPQISTPSSSLHSTHDGDSGGTPFQVQPEPLSLSSLFGPTRKSYSVCMKKKMCQYKEANPSATYDEIIEHLKTEYNIEIISSAIETIFHNNPTRQAYSVARKKYICRYLEDNPHLSRTDVVDHFNQKFGTNMLYGTLNNILRKKEKWMSIPEGQAQNMKCKITL